MFTQVLILSSVDKYLVWVITRAMPSYLDYVHQRSLVPMCQGYASYVFCFFRGLLLANSTYSIHINETASTKMIPLYNCHKAEGMPQRPNAPPKTSQRPIDLEMSANNGKI